ncbi:hypothetical protein U6A24_12905 [Aquimarina gracilis]|uniref:Zinc ribbon domain-containing protein n=1 Tax=Aquimarina gracilis TaxID=874422 RepID=A0ABU5ZWX1_9FLAO|nr:hypothetical protein [Aquimarina gracilis]MEB3346369.1 hypothetical protein [Aquimarina gracilis]
MSDVYRKCPECGIMNLNRDYCEQCGVLVNTNMRRQKERQQRIKKKKAVAAAKKPNRITLFFEKAKTHPNPIIRFVVLFFYSIWIVVLAIGSFLALIIGYITA